MSNYTFTPPSRNTFENVNTDKNTSVSSDFDINIHVAIKTKSVDELMIKYNCSELKVYAKHANIKGVSKMNKLELASKIVAVLNDSYFFVLSFAVLLWQ